MPEIQPARETIIVAIEYYESSSNLLGYSNTPRKIKIRAKRFVNWVNKNYSKTYNVNSNLKTVQNVRLLSNELHQFFRENITTDNGKTIIGYVFHIEVTKRNEDYIFIEQEYGDN